MAAPAGYSPLHVALLTGDVAQVRALLDAGADVREARTGKGGRSMGTKSMVAYRHGRAHAHPPESAQRAAEHALCDALDKLLDERGAPATLDDMHWWTQGVVDASDIAAKQGRPWK
ncbi:ankyrin repeat domain-containing protein [Pseudoxanthomonas sp. Root630]|uniref:ankyrin repeat domain-containing protein n=1 Tax=Pseudoxanthomonas sp. Root630 TaxID=1736574 RepID=UPI00070329CA|nr:ankyrin repeat domain-containing protein [Pseudoxanthomonas sp. Root630]KRA47589.1 hypothetical protein ASD72_20180 [Pseudoxanthomonas sp. Root630]